MNNLSADPKHIGDRFEVLELLGRGGFAAVYLARDGQLGRQVAIKIYHPQDTEDAAALGREAQILASLRHPNIVTVHDAGLLPDGRPFIVMEYLAGGSLRDKLKPSAPTMRPQDALGLVAVLAEALEAAHEANILHLDIKPENIIFDQRGRPYLTDFGIGRMMGGDNVTRQTRAMGTNNYASPEQRQGENLSPAADIYSLGVVLFELLTNQMPLGPAAAHPQPPFSPPFPMNHPLTAARDLVLLTCKALAVAPQYRYESASQFAQQLRDYFSHATGATGRLAAPARPFASSVTQVQIRVPERNLRLSEMRRIPQSVREMQNDLPPLPPATRANSLLYSHQKAEVGMGSVVEQGIFARGHLRLRQDAIIRGDAVSLTMLDVSQGVQANNLFAPEVMLRGPVRLEGSIFCRRLRLAPSGGHHLPEGSELGGSLIFAGEFEKVVPDEKIGSALNEPRQPIEVYHRSDVTIGAHCTLVAILGDVNVEVGPRQKQLNTIRVTGNVTLDHHNTVRRIEGEDVLIGPGCHVNEVHARGKLTIHQGSIVGFARAGNGIELAHNVTISSPVLFSDNGAILEHGEARWKSEGKATGLTAYQLFDYERDGQKGSLATNLLDHRLYELYERIAPGWMPRLKPTQIVGGGERVRQPALPKSMPQPGEADYLEFEMDLTPASERDATRESAPLPVRVPEPESNREEEPAEGALPAAELPHVEQPTRLVEEAPEPPPDVPDYYAPPTRRGTLRPPEPSEEPTRLMGDEEEPGG